MSDLTALPDQQELFVALVRGLFPHPDVSGVVIRTIEPVGSPIITVVYVTDLIAAGDLERLVLSPLAQGAVQGPPEALERSGRLPAAHLRLAANSDALVAGLLDGLAAVHIDGYAGAVLAGNGLQGGPSSGFGPTLEVGVATLYRQLRRVDLQAERHTRADGSRIAILYLKTCAAPETVQAVRMWSLNLNPAPAKLPLWRSMLNVLRLPIAVQSSAPPAVAEALTKGYVAVFLDSRQAPLVAPTTLDLLLSSPGDAAMAPALRRLATWPRLLATALCLTLSAGLVAVSSYHHSLIPGPFLVAMATSRSNLPFPVVGEILLVSLLSDAFEAAAIRLGGRRLILLALAALLVALMAMMQVGVLGGISGVVGIVAATVRATLPSSELRRIVRIWRYCFVGAAAGLGVYGMAILLFAMAAYLAEEKVLEHPVRLPPTRVSG